jgi:hypothetical protein
MPELHQNDGAPVLTLAPTPLLWPISEKMISVRTILDYSLYIWAKGYGLEPEPEQHNFFNPEPHQNDAAPVLAPAQTHIL